MSSVRKLLKELNSLVNSPLRRSGYQKAQQMCQAYANLVFDVNGRSFNAKINPYRGDNPQVLGMMSALKSQKGIHAVILQGSLATEEEIGYSDFDVLVILDDSVFKSPKVLLKVVLDLQGLSKYMFAHDPLQHHGWFVSAEKLLNHHFDDFFPAAIFDYSRSLFPTNGVEINLQLVKDESAFKAHLIDTVKSIHWEIESGRYVQNLYELKSTLSKFMLLPALYMQVRKGEGVYKKDSFELAKAHFTADEWNIMDEISSIRDGWNQNMAGWRRWLITAHPSWSRKMAKRIAPKVAADLQARVKDKSSKMQTFARLMLERAKATNGQN